MVCRQSQLPWVPKSNSCAMTGGQHSQCFSPYTGSHSFLFLFSTVPWPSVEVAETGGRGWQRGHIWVEYSHSVILSLFTSYKSLHRLLFTAKHNLLWTKLRAAQFHGYKCTVFWEPPVEPRKSSTTLPVVTHTTWSNQLERFIGHPLENFMLLAN